MKFRFWQYTALTLLIFLSFCTIQAENLSKIPCLQKVQAEIALNNYIEVTDFNNNLYCGFFKGIDYKKNSIVFMREEAGIEASMKSMKFDNISQIIAQKRTINNANIQRWTKIGIFAGFSVATIRVYGKQNKINGLDNQKEDLDFIGFITHTAIGAGIGAFIGFVSGGMVTVSQTITCKE